MSFVILIPPLTATLACSILDDSVLVRSSIYLGQELNRINSESIVLSSICCLGVSDESAFPSILRASFDQR